MVSKKQQKKFLEELYNNKKEELYYKTNVIEIKKAQSREKELFNLGEYLPNLLRSFLSLDYYNHMRKMGVMDNVSKEMAKTRKQGRENDVIEYINWIDSHKDFHELLNEEKVKKLGDELEELEKEYEEILKIIE